MKKDICGARRMNTKMMSEVEVGIHNIENNGRKKHRTNMMKIVM